MGLAFHAVADLLVTYETSRESWHAAAITGHSSFSKLFPISIGEMSILRDKNIYTVSQLLEVNDLTGRRTVDENRLLLVDFSLYPHLQHKLCLLIHSLHRAPVVDKFVTHTTTASSLFCLDKNLSQIFKQQHELHKIIQVPPSYLTCHVMELPYRNGLHSSMLTKSSKCRSCLKKPRKRFSRY
jgi:hypothetical protein